MAKPRQRRRRKHRGTQADVVRKRGRSGHAARPDGAASARERREARRNRQPTWRAAFNRGAIAASVFLALLVLVLKQSLGASLSIAVFVLLLYTPLFFFTDSFIYRLRQRRKERQAAD
jgi:Flp pilus assembly protein TadB